MLNQLVNYYTLYLFLENSTEAHDDLHCSQRVTSPESTCLVLDLLEVTQKREVRDRDGRGEEM